MNRLFEFFRIIVGDDRTLGIEQRALAVALENCPEVPAVTVVVGELGVLELWIQTRDILQELGVSPFTPSSGFFGVAVQALAHLGIGRIALLFGPHERRVRFVVPHRVSVKRIHENVGLVHMADHALRRWNGTRELMLERMPRFVLWNRRIHRLGRSGIPKLGIRPRVAGVTIICVNGMTRCTTR